MSQQVSCRQDGPCWPPKRSSQSKRVPSKSAAVDIPDKLLWPHDMFLNIDDCFKRSQKTIGIQKRSWPWHYSYLQVETLQKGQLTLVHFSRCHDFQKGRTLDRGIETTDCGSSDADFWSAQQYDCSLSRSLWHIDLPLQGCHVWQTKHDPQKSAQVRLQDGSLLKFKGWCRRNLIGGFLYRTDLRDCLNFPFKSPWPVKLSDR